MPSHLLDTDVVIWVLRGKLEAVSFLEQLLLHETPAISTITVYEIWSGVRSGEEEIIEELLSSFNVLPVTSEIGKTAARYFKEFRQKGITLSMGDSLIAATVFTSELTLVTQNQKHFPMTDIAKRGIRG